MASSPLCQVLYISCILFLPLLFFTQVLCTWSVCHLAIKIISLSLSLSSATGQMEVAVDPPHRNRLRVFNKGIIWHWQCTYKWYSVRRRQTLPPECGPWGAPREYRPQRRHFHDVSGRTSWRPPNMAWCNTRQAIGWSATDRWQSYQDQAQIM